MKKNGLAILFFLTTVIAGAWGYSQKQKADEWELKAYKMGEQAEQYRKIVSEKESMMIMQTIIAEQEAKKAVLESKKKIKK